MSTLAALISLGGFRTISAAVGSVSISPLAPSVQVDLTVQLTATVYDGPNGTGNILTGRTVAWSSDNEATATVDSSGLVTGRAQGSVTIRATCEGVQGAVDLSVTVAPDTTAPAAPTTLAAGTPVNLSIPLTWGAHPNTDGDLARFQLRYTSDNTAPTGGSPVVTLSSDPAATSATFSAALPNTLYRMALEAVDASGNVSALSNEVSATTGAAPATNEPAGMTTLLSMDGSSRNPGPAWTQGDAWSGANGYGDAKTDVLADATNPTGSGSVIRKRWYGPESTTAGAGATTTVIPCTLTQAAGAYLGRKATINGQTIKISACDGASVTLTTPLSAAPVAGDAVTIGGTLGDIAGQVGQISVWHWNTINPAFTPMQHLYVRLRIKPAANWPSATDAARAGMKFFYLKTSKTNSNGPVWTEGRTDWKIGVTDLGSDSLTGKLQFSRGSGAAVATPGSWHTVEFEFVINSVLSTFDDPAAHDGIWRIWVDGTLVAEKTSVCYVASDDTSWNRDFDGIEFYNLRGSPGAEMDRDDDYRLGEFYISGKATL